MIDDYNRFIPKYYDDSDYNTNATSYYDDLARKQKLIELLSKKIWKYEEKLDLTLEDIESRVQQRFSEWDGRIESFPENVETLLQGWLSDGKLDHIINDTIFNWKADQSELDKTNKQLAQTRRWITPEEMPEFNVDDASVAINKIFADGNNLALVAPKYRIKNQVEQPSNTKAINLNNSVIEVDRVIVPTTMWFISGVNIRLEKIKLDGLDVSTNGFYAENVDGIEWVDCVADNFINFNLVATLSDNVLIKGCKTSKSAHQGGIAVAHQCHNVIIEDSETYDTGAYGIIAEEDVFNLKIRRNKVKKVWSSGIGVVNTKLAPENNALVEDNTVNDVAQEAYLQLDAPNTTFKNNSGTRGIVENPNTDLSYGIRSGLRVGKSKYIGNVFKGFLNAGIKAESTDNGEIESFDNVAIDSASNREWGLGTFDYADLKRVIESNNRTIGEQYNTRYTNVTEISKTVTEKNQPQLKVKKLGPTYPQNNTSSHNTNLELNLETLIIDTFGTNISYKTATFDFGGFDGSIVGSASYKLVNLDAKYVITLKENETLTLSGVILKFPTTDIGQWFNTEVAITIQ